MCATDAGGGGGLDALTPPHTPTAHRREQTHQLILNAAIDDTFRLASQELKLKSAFAFVWFNPETNKPLTYSLKVKKSDSIELLFNGIKAAQAGSQ